MADDRGAPDLDMSNRALSIELGKKGKRDPNATPTP